MGFFSPEQTSTNYLAPAKLRASRNIGGSFAHPQTKTTHAGNGAPRCRYARFANGTPRRSPNDAREQKGHLGTDNFGFVRSKFSAAFEGFGRQKNDRPSTWDASGITDRRVLARQNPNPRRQETAYKTEKTCTQVKVFLTRTHDCAAKRAQRSSGKRLQRIEGSTAIGTDGAQALAGRRRDFRLRAIGRASRSQPLPYSAREAMLALLSAIFASMRSLSAPSAIVGW